MFVLRLLPVVELGLTFCEAELSVTQHSHCEYWLNAFAHILGVEFVFAEIASTSQTIRTSFFTMFALVCASDRFLSAKTHILCS